VVFLIPKNSSLSKVEGWSWAAALGSPLSFNFAQMSFEVEAGEALGPAFAGIDRWEAGNGVLMLRWGF
jgi:hypothetical protein